MDEDYAKSVQAEIDAPRVNNLGPNGLGVRRSGLIVVTPMLREGNVFDSTTILFTAIGDISSLSMRC